MLASKETLSISRRSLLAGAALASLACRSGRNAPSRPNILFAFADDQSWPHTGADGDTIVKTPAFDRVAREGVRFTRSWSACPSCTPSRSAVLTGRYPWQVEEGGVLYGTLPPRYPLFTHLLEDAGYHVGYTGKPWGPGDWQAGGLQRHPNGKEFNARRMGAPVEEGIDARDYAANFDDFLAARESSAPFFFWFGCTEPHRVYSPGIGLRTGKRLQDVRIPAYWPDAEIIRSDILDYYAEVEWFDSHLARMLASLERAGELDNTIVVVTSDNGMPFPRAKVNVYDAGVHMPLAIRWGNRVAGGDVVEDFVSHIDFAPTFLEAAGLKPAQAVTGRSLLPLLQSGRSGILDPSRDCALASLERHVMARPSGETYPIRGIRTSNYLYLRNFAPDRWPTGGPFLSSNKTYHGDVDACPTKTFMTDPANQRKYSSEYDLCFGKRPLEELYDVRSDPDQVRNLAADPTLAEAKETLWRRLKSELERTGDPRIRGEDPWQGYVYHQTIGYGAGFNLSLPEAERRLALERDTHKPE